MEIHACAAPDMPQLTASQQGHPKGGTTFSRMHFHFKHLPMDLHMVAGNKTQQLLEAGRCFGC